MSNRPPSFLIPVLEAIRRGDDALARRHAESALLDVGDTVDLRHLAGIACCRLGDLPAGITHLSVALDAQPDNVEVRIALAKALLDSGAPERGREIARLGQHPDLLAVEAEAARALADHATEAEALAKLSHLQPSDGGLRRAHGHALVLAGNLDGAAEALDYAVQLDPNVLDAWIELAKVLVDLDQSENAFIAYHNAEAYFPGNPDLILGQARELVKLRRFDDAEVAYRRAVGSAPSKADPNREFGLLLERTGRVGEVAELLDRAVAAGVPRGELSLLDAMMAFRDKDHARALSLLLRTPEEDQVKRLRLKAKIHEAAGDFDAAFDAATAMNDAVPDRARWLSRGASARAAIRLLQNFTTAEWASRFPPPDPGERPSPAFIVGFPRSGTTLLDTFLMGHRDATVLEEEPMLEAAKAIVGELIQLPEVDAATITRARKAYFEALDQRISFNEHSLVIDKMPFNMLGAGLIYRLFPDARIIFAQRHPCDVVLSGFMQSFRLNDGMASFLDLEGAADLYDASMSVWSATRAHLPLMVHDLVYEDLVDDPATTLRNVVEFLGLEWDDDLLDHVATAKARGTIITPSYDQVIQPISRKAVGRWRAVSDRLQPVLPVLLPWARRLGYAD